MEDDISAAEGPNLTQIPLKPPNLNKMVLILELDAF